MDTMEMWHQMGLFAKVSLLISLLPLVMATAYLVHPNERRLALMRPFSLAGLFAGLATLTVGFVHVLAGIAVTYDPANAESLNYGAIAAGASESFVPVTLGLACLSVAWLFVAVGMSRGRVDP
jgi:hypothetical protein